MRTDLEKYLQANRRDLDVETPDDQLIWEGLRNELQAEKGRGYRKNRRQLIRNYAAAVVVLLSLGYVAHDLLSERAGKRFDLSSINEELGTRENEYKSLVAYKLNEAMPANEIDNLIIKELFEEIDRLDTIYEVTLKDLKEMGYNEQAINTIFDTYEKKIYLLELIILENNKIQNHETDQSLFL